MRPLGHLAFALLVLWGCDAGGLELSVDARSDVALGQVDAMRVEVLSSSGETLSAPMLRAVAAGTTLSSGTRVGDFRGLLPGPTVVLVQLLRGPDVVLERRVSLDLETSQVLEVHLSSRCLGTSCPSATESECATGTCVAPSCGGGQPESCGPLSCREDSECSAKTGCVIAHCARFECVCDEALLPGDDGGPPLDAGALDAGAGDDAGADDAGGRDAGADEDAGGTPVDSGPNECNAGQTDTATRPCGECAEGSQQRSRACNGGSWEPFGDWSSCATSAECSPGQTSTRTQACGNCGSQSQRRSCNAATCRWGAFANEGGCGGQGVCAPGATRAGCDTCGHEVCGASCAWGGCTPRPGNACLHEGGTAFECCSPPGGGPGWQFCNPATCQRYACQSHSCP